MATSLLAARQATCHVHKNRVGVACRSQRRHVILGTAALTLGASVPNSSAGAIEVNAADSLPLVPKYNLTSDLAVSQIIKGNWQLAGGHKGDRRDDRTSGAAAIEDFGAFVAAGITTFDTADIYGPSEGLIGQYIRSRPQGADGLQILTKCSKFGSELQSISQSAISQSVSGSLQRLGLKQLDLVQFFWSDYSVPKYVAAAQYLAEEQARGRVRHLAVTNFDVPRMQKMMDGGVRFAASQVGYSLLDRRAENGMIQYCQANDIKILPFGTVAGGFLSDKYLGLPVNKVKLDTWSKSKYGSIIAQVGGWDWFQQLLRTLDAIANKHGSSISNVAGRWVLDRPMVAGLLVGARNASHVPDHRAMFSLQLDAEDLAAIDEVLEKGNQPTSDIYTWERGGSW